MQEHRYDAGGIRKSTKPSTTYYSSGGASLADIQPGGNLAFLQADQIRGHELGGSFYYYLTDVQSSVRLIVDSSGNVQSSFAYKAFGDYEGNPSDAGGLGYMGYLGGLGVRNDLENTGAGNSNFGPKLLYMRQRWYDPGLGRWLSQDPIGFAGGLNLYAYVGNNPVNGVDPIGLRPGQFSDPRANLNYLNQQADQAVDRSGPWSAEAVGLRGSAFFYGFLGLGTAQDFGSTWGDPNSSHLDRLETAGWLGLNLLGHLAPILDALRGARIAGPELEA